MEKIEKLYTPVINILEEESFLESVKNDYKGFITAQTSVIANPDILFIGINPGEGAFIEMNINNKPGASLKYPKRLYSDTSITELDWLKDGNARGEFIGKKWNGYKWYQTNKKVNNLFVKRMVDFFFSYYEINDNSDYSELQKKIESEIFYWNLYPIATKSTIELNLILREIIKRRPILNGKEPKVLPELKNFFRQRTIDLIYEVKPKKIVCLGSQAFRELVNPTFKVKLTNATKEYRVKFRRNDIDQYSVYVISRSGNWEEKIQKLGRHLRH